jgi:N-formylglutamate deformylase
MDLPVAETPAWTRTPYRLVEPNRQSAPIVLASPHSGRDYAADFLAQARLDPLALRRSEDCFVDDLFAAAPEFGIPLLAATFPRAYCDVNREAWELDPAMFAEPLPPWVNATSSRVSAGLGTIPRIVASGEVIYVGKLSFADAERRINDCWRPYHDALAALIARTRGTFGACLLLDCHSMPTSACAGRAGTSGIDMVLGDAHGTTCAPAALRLVERVLGELGYTTRRNDPYAGGFVTRHYGRPREGVHVLQIELARRLYMDEARIEQLPRFARLQRDLTTLLEAIADAGLRILLP